MTVSSFIFISSYFSCSETGLGNRDRSIAIGDNRKYFSNIGIVLSILLKMRIEFGIAIIDRYSILFRVFLLVFRPKRL